MQRKQPQFPVIQSKVNLGMKYTIE